MADKVDMSLDDIIAVTKKSGRRGYRGRGGGRGRGRRTGGPRRSGESPRQNRGGASGRVQKRRGGGSFGHSRQLSDDTVWEESFNGGGRHKSQISRQNNQNKEVRLMVSNLDYAVTEDDIYELFAEFGRLKRESVHYDRHGRSLGTAEVVFERRGDALKALKKYNNVRLDGLPMQIELIGGEGDVNGSATRGFSARRQGRPRGQDQGRPRSQDQDRTVRQGRAPYQGQDRKVRRGGGGPPGGRGRGGRSERKVPTAEQLEAQLLAYINKMDTDSD